MSAPPYDVERLNQLADELAAHAKELAQAGWTPATSSNFSQRLDARHVAITVSGRDKGRLGRADIMVIDLEGNPVATAQRPSAEMRLHTQLSRQRCGFGDRLLGRPEQADSSARFLCERSPHSSSTIALSRISAASHCLEMLSR